VTKDTPPSTQVAWEPITEGILLGMDSEEFKLNMNDVRELRDDMMEAYMNSRGYEKAEVELGDIEDGWIVYLFDNQFRVASTFLEARSKYAGRVDLFTGQRRTGSRLSLSGPRDGVEAHPVRHRSRHREVPPALALASDGSRPQRVFALVTGHRAFRGKSVHSVPKVCRYALRVAYGRVLYYNRPIVEPFRKEENREDH
jgi:hypothetical protein